MRWSRNVFQVSWQTSRWSWCASSRRWVRMTIGPRPGLQAFHPGLQLAAVVGEEAVAEGVQLDLHPSGSGRESLGAKPPPRRRARRRRSARTSGCRARRPRRSSRGSWRRRRSRCRRNARRGRAPRGARRGGRAAGLSWSEAPPRSRRCCGDCTAATASCPSRSCPRASAGRAACPSSARSPRACRPSAGCRRSGGGTARAPAPRPRACSRRCPCGRGSSRH